MIDSIDVLNSHFSELSDALAGVDLGGIESAAWALLIAIEGLDRSLGVLPDAGPDFSACRTPRALADMAHRQIDAMDAHLIQHQRAHQALIPLMAAFEQAREAGEAAEFYVNEIDRQLLNLERHT